MTTATEAAIAKSVRALVLLNAATQAREALTGAEARTVL